MRIGLVAVDGHNRFPNLALMRLSAWHKRRGDMVEWWNGFERYDRVYMSKVFTFTPDFDTAITADEIVTGGTGYKDYGSLPREIEACPPDYTLYPGWKSAIGFLTRGCCRACEWCIVPRKEGMIHPALHWMWFVRLACDTSEMLPVIRQRPGSGLTRWCWMWRKRTAVYWRCKGQALRHLPSHAETTTAVSRQRNKNDLPGG